MHKEKMEMYQKAFNLGMTLLGEKGTGMGQA
jgi:hypothetical protein